MWRPLPNTKQRARIRSLRCRHRRGIATVELAVILPMFFVVVLGTIELCQYMFLRQSATIVAYEGVRLAVRSRCDRAMVVARCEALLQQRRVVGGEVVVSPSDLMVLPSGTPVEVRINVPHARNSPTFFVLKNLGTISVSGIMLRE